MTSWVSVPAFEDIYEVSSNGDVRRIAPGAGRAKVGGVLRPGKNPKGYLAVCLCRAGKTKTKFLHVLVCEAFHGPKPTRAHQAAHRDGDKLNNAASNLYWATPQQNYDDRRRHGSHLTGSRIGRSKLTEADIPQIRALREAGLLNSEIGARFGVAPHTISRVVSGARWGHIAKGG